MIKVTKEAVEAAARTLAWCAREPFDNVSRSKYLHDAEAVLAAALPHLCREAEGAISPGARAILAERRRQIDAEGWTVEHDDSHALGELCLAGAAYAEHASYRVNNSFQSPAGDVYPLPKPSCRWPWSRAWWKPRNFRRDLVRAGALILAEIEKFDRASGLAVAPSPPVLPHLHATPEWLHMETAPMDGSRILAVDKAGNHYVLWFDRKPNQEPGWYIHGSYVRAKPVGWMPLPLPVDLPAPPATA